jgi:ribose transport system permease protein
VLTALLFGPRIVGLPVLPIALMLAVAVAGILFQRSRFALALREIGAETEHAHAAGPLRCMAYTIAGLGYGATGILLAGQIGAADSMLGMPVLLQIFAAIALAGSCPGLRSGSIPGALLGAAIVAAAANLLIPLGIPDILSPAVDAFWLLLGIAGCALLRDRPPRRVDFTAPNARPAVIVAAIGVLALIALTLWRPEAAGIATIAAGLAFLVVGQGAVMRLGGFDLAMPAMIAVGGMMTVSISQGTLGGFAFTLLVLAATAILLGAWHAFLAPHLGRAIILATLASAGVMQAIAAAFMVWSPTGFAPPHLTALSAQLWLGLPLPAWIFLPAALALAMLLDRRRGSIIGAYVASALSAALFGSLLACIGGGFRLGLVDITLVPVVAGAVLGGIDFLGGRGSLLAAIGAVLLLQLADTLLVGLRISYEARLTTMGLLILLRTGFDLAHRPLPRRDQG